MIKAYHIKYSYQGEKPSSKYSYQRFFRAMYGYTQVVKKSNGKTYVYYREGVLTTFPYIKTGKNIVIIPSNALNPLIKFFQEGTNPAHEFHDISDWQVIYYVEEKSVEERDAERALLEALERIIVPTEMGYSTLLKLVNKTTHTLDEIAAIKLKARNIVESNWFSALKNKEPFSRLQLLFNRAEETI